MKNLVCNGTYYHIDTPVELVKLLEKIRLSRTRIVLDYGDPKTGQSWAERHYTAGRIGRSTGDQKIPILLATQRSWGGPAILDHCIVRIVTSQGKRELYRHPNYQPYK